MDGHYLHPILATKWVPLLRKKIVDITTENKNRLKKRRRK